MDRLRLHTIGTAEDFDPRGIGDGKEIVRARDPDGAGKDRLIRAHVTKEFRIGREHDGDVRPRRMACDEQALRIPAAIRELLVKECRRFRSVLDEVRKPMIWKEAIIGDADDDALARERLADETVFAPMSADEPATIE